MVTSNFQIIFFVFVFYKKFTCQYLCTKNNENELKNFYKNLFIIFFIWWKHIFIKIFCNFVHFHCFFFKSNYMWSFYKKINKKKLSENWVLQTPVLPIAEKKFKIDYVIAWFNSIIYARKIIMQTLITSKKHTFLKNKKNHSLFFSFWKVGGINFVSL